MSRIGGFQGPTTPYGVPPSAIHPKDNDITPSNAQAEADQAKATADALLDDIRNALRDPNAKKASA